MHNQSHDINQALHRAVNFHQSGRFREAEEIYRAVLRVAPGNADALHFLGVLAYQTGNLAGAVESIGGALRIDPNIAEAHYNLAKALADQGKLDEAVESYRRAASIDPNIAEAHYNLGLALSELGRPDEAAESYRRAISINPNDPDAHYNLGNAYTELKRLREAVECYENALRLKPDFPRAHVNLGIAFKELGRFDLAIAAYREAIAFDPDNADTHFNLANALDEEGLLDEAIESLRRAIRLDPNHAKAYSKLGNTLTLRGATGEAIECYQRAIQLNPGNDSARHLLAALKGQTTEAAPTEYVKALFDKCAERFEGHLVNKLSYKSPMEIRRAFDGLVKDGRRFVNMIDLGCGSGLAGQEFRGIADRLTGVDIAPKMIEVARRKNVYDVLRAGDIVETLNASGEKYDLFVATDVLVYVGNLRPLFGSIQAHALSGAYLAFTTESQEEQDFSLRPSGRYAHSRAYLRSLADEYGFVVERCESAVLRTDKGQDIMGNHAIMRYAR